MADEKDAAAEATPPGGAKPGPVGSPPMTRLEPGTGATPSAQPYGRSNTIGPGIVSATTAGKAPAAEREGVSRRSFMKWSLPVGWVAFSAACASSLVATARFLFPNVLFEPPQSFKAGFPGEYNVGEVDVRWKDAYGVWIVRNPEGFYALIAVCTHLGCSPTLKKEVGAASDMGADWPGGYYCPCHNSRFDLSARVFKGSPAPSNLKIPPHRYESDAVIVIGEDSKGA